MCGSDEPEQKEIFSAPQHCKIGTGTRVSDPYTLYTDPDPAYTKNV